MDFNYNGANGFDKNFVTGINNDFIHQYAGFFIFLIVIILIVFFTLLGIYIAGKWKLYKKAGKQGWESIVPFYNDWVYVEIAGLNWWWFFFLIIAPASIFSNFGNGDSSFIINIAGLVGAFVCNYNISKKLGKDTGFAILMTLFPFVVVPLIGFSSSYTWNNNAEVSLNGPFDNVNNSNKSNNASTSTTTKSTVKKEKDSKFCTNCGNEISKGDKFCSNCGKEI